MVLVVMSLRIVSWMSGVARRSSGSGGLIFVAALRKSRGARVIALAVALDTIVVSLGTRVVALIVVLGTIAWSLGTGVKARIVVLDAIVGTLGAGVVALAVILDAIAVPLAVRDIVRRVVLGVAIAVSLINTLHVARVVVVAALEAITVVNRALIGLRQRMLLGWRAVQEILNTHASTRSLPLDCRLLAHGLRHLDGRTRVDLGILSWDNRTVIAVGRSSLTSRERRKLLLIHGRHGYCGSGRHAAGAERHHVGLRMAKVIGVSCVAGGACLAANA